MTKWGQSFLLLRHNEHLAPPVPALIQSRQAEIGPPSSRERHSLWLKAHRSMATAFQKQTAQGNGSRTTSTTKHLECAFWNIFRH